MSSQPQLVDIQQSSTDVRTPRAFTAEHLLYGLIFLIALFTRFWDLGSRALHHDESEHAYFSWIFAIGGGYKHDPLLHGPFLFHVGALMFWLFGASNAMARAFPALVGVVVVMLPWLLRSERLLGRWGALTASVLLLISPTILYYSRFLRHDIYCLAATFLLFIAIVRYVDAADRKWAILGGVAIGLLLCTKEVSFIVLFLFVTFLAVAVAYRVAPALFAVAAGTLAVLGVVVKLVQAGGAAPLPAIPWDNPTGAQIRHFAAQLIQHPLVIGALGVLVVGLVIAPWVLDRARKPELGWVDGLLRDVPDDSTAAAFRELLRERRGLSAGIVLCLGIFVLLYTSLFTNMEGLASGTFGALGYWLGQQNVQRGA
ncbi:MAG TPA: flippase activity-associated protein Agl23, partial [Nitrolancea sp.]|nr:flippase activity-associated protein Agl23 [Nitrolancea sp.]